MDPRRMLVLLSVVIAVLLRPCSGTHDNTHKKTHNKINVENVRVNRTATLYWPKDGCPDDGCPLVMFLQAESSMAVMMEDCFNRHPWRQFPGWAVVLPHTSGDNWTMEDLMGHTNIESAEELSCGDTQKYWFHRGLVTKGDDDDGDDDWNIARHYLTKHFHEKIQNFYNNARQNNEEIVPLTAKEWATATRNMSDDWNQGLNGKLSLALRRKIPCWNAGVGSCFAVDDKVEDAEFLEALLDNLTANSVDRSGKVDKTRLYVVGQGNGAAMAVKLATHLAKHKTSLLKLAGVAPQSGRTYEALPEGVFPPIFMQWGKHDKQVPIDGVCEQEKTCCGIGNRTNDQITNCANTDLSVETWVEGWVAPGATRESEDVDGMAGSKLPPKYTEVNTWLPTVHNKFMNHEGGNQLHDGDANCTTWRVEGKTAALLCKFDIPWHLGWAAPRWYHNAMHFFELLDRPKGDHGNNFEDCDPEQLAKFVNISDPDGFDNAKWHVFAHLRRHCPTLPFSFFDIRFKDNETNAQGGKKQKAKGGRATAAVPAAFVAVASVVSVVAAWALRASAEPRGGDYPLAPLVELSPKGAADLASP